MSTLNDDTQDTQGTQDQPNDGDELKVLKDRARLMGITFSNNISVETLREKIAAKMSGGEKTEAAEQPQPELKANPLASQAVAEDKPVKRKSLRKHLFDEEMKLIRVRIQCLDPKKANLPGEVLCVANEYLGNVKKFIPYGEATDGGYHIENCLYKTLRDRQFLQIRTVKDKKTGTTRPVSTWMREFAIEVLPPLTPQELEDLKVAQIAAGSIDPA